jgi:DNA-binding response OmpR family regulator
MADCVFLQADDDDAAHQMLQIALDDMSIPVALYRVTDGEQALAFLWKREPYQAAPRPDLVILDVNLPKKSGRDVLAQIRRDHSLSTIPVIMFTSSSRAIDRRDLFALGATDYIIKPPTYKAFLDVVRSFHSRCVA